MIKETASGFSSFFVSIESRLYVGITDNKATVALYKVGYCVR